MSQILTAVQANELEAFFKIIDDVINIGPNSIRNNNMFDSMFGTFYALPSSAKGWQEDHKVSVRELDYYQRKTTNMAKMVTGMAKYVERLGADCPPQLRSLDGVNRIMQNLIPVIAYREQHHAATAANAKVATDFLNAVFAEVNTNGFGRFKFDSFGRVQRPNKRLELQASAEPSRTAIELHMWKPGKDLHAKRTVNIYNGDSVEVVRKDVQAAWDAMSSEIVGDVKAQDAKLIELKMSDRLLTEQEIKLIGTMLAVSNLGQPMTHKVEGDTLFVNGVRLELSNLDRCYGYVNSLLDRCVENDETEKAVNAEQKSWFRILRGQEKVGDRKAKPDTLFSVAQTWTDFIPLCLWLAYNNK
jgi:hypothetical protein